MRSPNSLLFFEQHLLQLLRCERAIELEGLECERTLTYYRLSGRKSTHNGRSRPSQPLCITEWKTSIFGRGCLINTFGRERAFMSLN